MPFARIAIEQAIRRIAADRRRKLPSKVHRVAKPEIEPLAAQRGMDVSGVASEQHTSVAVSRCLVGAVRPRCGKLEGCHGDIGAGDTA
jgi:hypothetical protein